MDIEEVETFEAFLNLEAQWEDLWRRSQCQSFFLSHRWFRCCWPEHTTAVRPLVLVVRENKQVVGIAPFLRHRATWRIFPARAVTLMQNQDSPFGDVVLARDGGDRALGAIVKHLTAMSGWHLLALAKLEQSSSTHGWLAEYLAGQPHLRIAVARSPVLVFDRDWKTFWEGQSQRFKKTVRNIVNRVERLGKTTVEEMGSEGTVADCFEVFRSVAARSWKAELPISVSRNSEIGRFFRTLTEALQSSGRLSLWVLRLDGVPIAAEYHVRDGNTVYALRSDFDDCYRDASPGAYLNHQIVRTYFERNIRVYDMGPGDSDYKERWATAAKDLDTFWIFNRTAYPMALYNVERRAVPYLRQARGWFPGYRAAGASKVAEKSHGLGC